MISILIPIFNWDVSELVRKLQRQCEMLHVPFEILAFEDGSDPVWQQKNSGLGDFFGINYRIFSSNLGRSRIRNELADQAQYPFLLFLDCDSGILREDFIKQYLDQLQEETVLYGGREYQKAPPSEKALLLHWRFGRYREQLTVTERQKEPYHRFMTNNFLIPRSIFQSIRFDERLLQYGHEDTLFGLELRKRSVSILHLDNPVIHLGLETADSFLEKNRQAMQNLAFLLQDHPDLETRLLGSFRQLKKWKLAGLAYSFLSLILPWLRRDLLSTDPHLQSLDLFKLYSFLKYERTSFSK